MKKVIQWNNSEYGFLESSDSFGNVFAIYAHDNGYKTLLVNGKQLAYGDLANCKREAQEYSDKKGGVKKVIQLEESTDPIQAAVDFEVTLGEVVAHYMGAGLKVSNAVGVLTCVTSEITLSFNLARGMVDERTKAIIGLVKEQERGNVGE